MSLFADDPVFAQYRYSAWVTDMDLPAAELWRLHRGHTDRENCIKELKYDFGGQSFNPVDFLATEAALMTIMLAYNSMNLFRQAVLRSDRVSGKPDSNTPLKP
ncbi:transposase [Nitrosomonas sp. Nm34]|uniref:transposase n=1 Tax=Nitrosomonas sp. Nm34 TaxID=1881055 RepID=UPI001587279A|nr:transposase [Nitrosomonas sp. Nm34]